MSDKPQDHQNDSILGKVEPPEVELKAPHLFVIKSTWLVVAKNRRVYRDWEDLMDRYPENCRRCYHDLLTNPMSRQPRRVFPLKGKPYKGAWEYEVTKGDRIYYIPDKNQSKVIVYYAGEHPSPAPIP